MFGSKLPELQALAVLAEVFVVLEDSRSCELGPVSADAATYTIGPRVLRVAIEDTSKFRTYVVRGAFKPGNGAFGKQEST